MEQKHKDEFILKRKKRMEESCRGMLELIPLDCALYCDLFKGHPGQHCATYSASAKHDTVTSEKGEYELEIAVNWTCRRVGPRTEEAVGQDT